MRNYISFENIENGKIRALIYALADKRKIMEILEFQNLFDLADFLQEHYPPMIILKGKNDILESEYLSFAELIEIALDINEAQKS